MVMRDEIREGYSDTKALPKPGGRAGSRNGPLGQASSSILGKVNKSGRAGKRLPHQMVLTHLLCGVCHRLSSTVSTLPPSMVHPQCTSQPGQSPVSWRPVPTSAVSRGHISHSLP